MIYIIFFLLIIICVVLTFLLTKKTKLDKFIIEQNEELKKKNKELNIENGLLLTTNGHLQEVKSTLHNQIENEKGIKFNLDTEIERSSSILKTLQEDNEKLAEEAYQKYVEALEDRYINAEADFDMQIRGLCAERHQVQKELDKLKATRAAAHKAMLKEEEIKKDLDHYRLLPSDADLADSRRLEIVKRELNKPRILCMLIWQTYWQPLAKKQFPLIIKNKTACGIYKITNITTEECYIGQAVDIYKRWCEHCKCGLGIDTPPGNKLYKAIQEYGLNNFTFEVIEECSSDQLNEKEKYFIELYQADTFGYNSTGGNK